MGSDLPICQRCRSLYVSKNKTNESQLQAAQARNAELEDKWQQFISGEAEHQEMVCIAECHDKKHGYCYDTQRCDQLEAENAALRTSIERKGEANRSLLNENRSLLSELEALRADLRGKDNDIEVLKSRVVYLKRYAPVDDDLAAAKGSE